MTGSRLAISLREIAMCLEGLVPAALATCGTDGVPNIAFLSIVHYVDADHVATSYQFFKKTRSNLEHNPVAQLLLAHPETCEQYRLDVVLERTDTDGPIFERMNARLEAVASTTGMAGHFKLRGADVYRVVRCESMRPDPEPPAPELGVDRLDSLDRFAGRLAAADDLDSLLAAALQGAAEEFGYRYSMLLLADAAEERLFAVGSHGFPKSGAGAEVAFGDGIVGNAARFRLPVRFASMARVNVMAGAVRAQTQLLGGEEARKVVPLGGLPHIESQMALPILSKEELLGVLWVQSPRAGAFLKADEQICQLAMRQLGSSMALLRAQDALSGASPVARSSPRFAGDVVVVRHYAADDSVFLDNEYLIKGVAGAILTKLIDAWQEQGQTQFSNRELRLDEGLGMPAFKDNLEARLILLRKRLEDHCDYLAIPSCGRGRFRLQVRRPLRLERIGGD